MDLDELNKKEVILLYELCELQLLLSLIQVL